MKIQFNDDQHVEMHLQMKDDLVSHGGSSGWGRCIVIVMWEWDVAMKFFYIGHSDDYWKLVNVYWLQIFEHLCHRVFSYDLVETLAKV